MKFTPHPYQQRAIEMIIDNPCCGLFLDMGLGKTVSTLTAIDTLKYADLEIEKVLVVAPKNVALNTWSSEKDKWDHLRHLTISQVLGTQRQRKDALETQADIYIINRENVCWLISYLGGGYFPFDMLVIDELSSFKSPKAQRFKALKMIRPAIKRVVGLTGTPAPNGLIDLWSQLYLIDGGVRLGKSITAYRSEYFTPGRTNGMVVFDYNPKQGSQEKIKERISDICLSMKAEDYLQLPARIDRQVRITLPEPLMREYKDFEKKQVLRLFEEQTTITAASRVAVIGKLLQFANGAIYDEEKHWHALHQEKIKALEEIIDTAGGNNVLVFYSFRSDKERLMQELKNYSPCVLEDPGQVQDWNQGRLPVLLAHPASAGHGLNLQAGGNIIVWFGLNWSLELYQQANARLHRQGQTKPVIIHHLIAQGTYDEDVLRALQAKENVQENLLQALKERARKYAELAGEEEKE